MEREYDGIEEQRKRIDQDGRRQKSIINEYEENRNIEEVWKKKRKQDYGGKVKRNKNEGKVGRKEVRKKKGGQQRGMTERGRAERKETRAGIKEKRDGEVQCVVSVEGSRQLLSATRVQRTRRCFVLL